MNIYTTQARVNEINHKMELSTGGESLGTLNFESKDKLLGGYVGIDSQQDLSQESGETEYLNEDRLKDEIEFLSDLAQNNKDDGEIKSYSDLMAIQSIYKVWLKTIKGDK